MGFGNSCVPDFKVLGYNAEARREDGPKPRPPQVLEGDARKLLAVAVVIGVTRALELDRILREHGGGLWLRFCGDGLGRLNGIAGMRTADWVEHTRGYRRFCPEL